MVTEGDIYGVIDAKSKIDIKRQPPVINNLALVIINLKTNLKTRKSGIVGFTEVGT